MVRRARAESRQKIMIAAYGAHDLAIGERDAVKPTFIHQPQRRSAAVTCGKASL